MFFLVGKQTFGFDTILAKEKVKGMFKKKHLRKQLDTIVYPQTNHTIYCVSWSFMFFSRLAETNPLERLWFWFQEKWS